MYFCWRAGGPRPLRERQVCAGGNTLLQAASGEHHSLLLLSDGTVQSCGDNSRGQLGRKGTPRGSSQVSSWTQMRETVGERRKRRGRREMPAKARLTQPPVF
uniref:Uncharacterized protein n=1 Tax=Bos mutus grunniens TaxID=30521 RepID=A0A8B9Y8F3_BOSMU